MTLPPDSTPTARVISASISPDPSTPGAFILAMDYVNFSDPETVVHVENSGITPSDGVVQWFLDNSAPLAHAVFE